MATKPSGEHFDLAVAQSSFRQVQNRLFRSLARLVAKRRWRPRDFLGIFDAHTRKWSIVDRREYESRFDGLGQTMLRSVVHANDFPLIITLDRTTGLLRFYSRDECEHLSRPEDSMGTVYAERRQPSLS